MDDFDLILTNLFYALATGEIASPLQNLRYSEQLIEERLYVDHRTSTPPDVILFSKHYKHAFVIEIKDISSSASFNENQARNYAALNTQSFRFALPNFRELNQMTFDVNYQGHEANKDLLNSCITASGNSFPVLVFDSENLRIYKDPNSADIQFNRLKTVMDAGIDIPIESTDQIPKYVHFTPETVNRAIAPLLLTGLVELNELSKDGTKKFVSLRDLTAKAHSRIKIWSKLDSHYQDQLIAKVRSIMTLLRENGLNDYLEVSGDNYWLDVFDENGQPNYAKLNAITARISASGFQIDQISLL